MNPIKKLFTILGELSTGIFSPQNSLLFTRSLFFWVVLIAIIVLSGLTFYRINNANKSANQNPSIMGVPDEIMAEVGNQKIYKNDVERLALETYQRDAITEEVLRTYLNVAIERTLLDQEAVRLNIIIPDNEITQIIVDEDLIDNQKNRDKIFYRELKAKMLEQIISSRTANVVEYWTPSVSNPDIPSQKDDPKFKAQREQGRKALPLIEQQLNETPDILEATREVMSKNDFKELAEVIAVNGLRLSTVTNEVELRTQYTFTTKDQEILGIEFFEALFNLGEGETQVIFRDENSAGKLYQVTKSSQGDYNTYEQWLSQRKAEKVKVLI